MRICQLTASPKTMLKTFYLATFSHIFVAVTIYNVYQTVLETLDLPHVSICKTIKFVSNNGFIIFLYRVVSTVCIVITMICQQIFQIYITQVAKRGGALCSRLFRTFFSEKSISERLRGRRMPKIYFWKL